MLLPKYFSAAPTTARTAIRRPTSSSGSTLSTEGLVGASRQKIVELARRKGLREVSAALRAVFVDAAHGCGVVQHGAVLTLVIREAHPSLS